MNFARYMIATGLAALPLALSLTLAAPAQANPEMAGQRGLSDSFATMDYNRDGKVDRDEFARAHPSLRPEAFAAIDVNKDLVITREEWEAFSKGHSKNMGMGAMPPADKGTPKAGKPGMITPPKGGAKGDKPMPPAAK